jgi:hypothetical protein
VVRVPLLVLLFLKHSVQLSNANPHALFATHFILEACTVKKGFNLSKNATRDAHQKRVFDHASILKSFLKKQKTSFNSG